MKGMLRLRQRLDCKEILWERLDNGGSVAVGDISGKGWTKGDPNFGQKSGLGGAVKNNLSFYGS